MARLLVIVATILAYMSAPGRAQSVRGTVLTAVGTPVEGALMEFQETPEGDLFSGVTDAAGYYEIALAAEIDAIDPPHMPLLEQNFPNPFNPSSTIVYSLPVSADVDLTIYNTLGHRVRRLDSGRRQAGSRRVIWDGTDEDGRGVSASLDRQYESISLDSSTATFDIDDLEVVSASLPLQLPSGLTTQLVGIPAGTFAMGSWEYDDEMPVHEVRLDPFYIQMLELTVAEYAGCVQAGACGEPARGEACNWALEDRDDHPVNCISWYDAARYCQWAGMRLPHGGGVGKSGTRPGGSSLPVGRRTTGRRR